jgi:glycine cleavage system H protein
MNFPDNFRYTKDHEWLLLQGDEALVGISDYAQSELGDIIFTEFASVGEQLQQGETFGSVEAVKAVSDVFMPVSGEILEINAKLTDNPELINQDPYGEGWMIRIRLLEPEEVDELMDATTYRQLIQ